MKSKRRKEEKQNGPDRIRAYSFVATLIVITIIIAVSYYQTLPTVQHIPNDFAFNTQEWMAYVPSNSEYVGYINYRLAYSVSGNSSLFGENPLIEFPQLGFDIIPFDIVYEVAIQLPEPQYSGSAILVQLSSTKLALLSSELASINNTKVPAPQPYDNYEIYGLLMREIGENTTTPGYLTLVNHYLLLSNDKTSDLRNIEAVLDQITTGRQGLFDDENVMRSVYATGVTDQDYVALFVGRFPTQLNDTEMATKTVVGNGGSIQVSRAFLFPSSDIALSHLSQAHTVYRNAANYEILDSWLVVTYEYSPTRIQTEIIGI
ncbi:MAG TPA: hypothetical protein VLV31_12765 [Candidatus Acidoferrales bacterium]|nr:hypothetical protein [Candidatus Acidoferrales bacterium]